MSEPISVAGLSDVELDYVNDLRSQLGKKRPRNELRRAYYEFRRGPREVSKVIPPHYRNLGLTMGWAGKAVDGLARRCSLTGFTWPDGDLADLGLPELMDANHFLSESKSGIVQALLYGPTFIANTVGGVGEPESLIHFLDALNTTGVWNPRTRRLDAALSITKADEHGDPMEFTLWLPGETITCVRDLRWSVVDRQQHAYGMPVEVMRHAAETRQFGSSRMTRPVMGIQDAAVRTLLRMEGHMDVYSFPEMWLLGADASIFNDEQGNPTPTWEVMLGRIKAIPDDDDAENPRADVRQFQASNPETHMAWLNALAKMMAKETGLPVSDFAITDYANPTSADAYIEGRDELIGAAEDATTEAGFALTRAIRRGLAIQNGDPALEPALIGLEAKWRSPVHLSRAAEADAGVKQLSAIPWLADTEVGLELAGLSDQQIRRAQAERRRSFGRDVLSQIAQVEPSEP